jgi:hypothetical protein
LLAHILTVMFARPRPGTGLTAGFLRTRSRKHCVVIARRQRGGRTLTPHILHEAEGIDFAQERIAPGTVLSSVASPESLPEFSDQHVNDGVPPVVFGDVHGGSCS